MASDVWELGMNQVCTHTPPADRLRGTQLDERRWNVIWVSITPQLAQDGPLSACAGPCHWSLGVLSPPSGVEDGRPRAHSGTDSGRAGPSALRLRYFQQCCTKWLWGGLSWLLAPGVDVVIAVGVSGRGPEHVLGGLLVWVTYREFRSTCGTWRLCRVIPPPHHPRSLSLLTCEVDTLVVPPRGLLKG